MYYNITTVRNFGVNASSVGFNGVTAAGGSDSASGNTVTSNSGVTVVIIDVTDGDGDGQVTIDSINLTGFDTSNADSVTGLDYDVNATLGTTTDGRFDGSNGNAPDADDFQTTTFAIGGGADSTSISGFVDPLPRGTISDNTPQSVISTGSDAIIGDLSFSNPGNVTNVTVNATGGGDGDISDTAIESVTVELYSGGQLKVEETRTYGGHNTTVTFTDASGNATNVTNVDRIVVRAQIEGSVANQPQTIDAELFVQTNPTGTVDTQNTQTVNDNTNGFFSGRVSTPDNQPVAGANVTATRDDGLVVNTQTNQDGDYTLEAPPGNYTLEANATNFRAAQPKDGEIVANETTSADFVLRPLLFPTTITVTPEDDSAFVGEENTFTVTVEDQNGDPLSTSVTATSGNDAITFANGDTETTKQTDASGQVTFTVTSDEVVSGAEITFDAGTDKNGNEVTTTATKSFIQNGEGEIDGTVLNTATTDPVENASVYTVLQSTFQSNTVQNTVNLDELGVTNGVIYIRLVDNETGEILDALDAEYRIQTPDASDTAVRRLSSLNESDESVGEGYAIIDADNDGVVTFTHTRIEPREYYAQVSFTAPLNSDNDEVGDAANPAEAFVNVTNTSSADGSGTVTAINTSLFADNTSVVFGPTTNLTLEATKERATASNSNLVDAPGFVNTFGVDTAGTNENGQFKLSRLFTNFQQGQNYTVIADKTGFATEFGEVFVTEDGATFTDSPFQGFNLDPIPVEAEQVNIVQVGTHPPLSETEGAPGSELQPFGDQTDDTFQTVPRDGETLDVIRVETTTDQGEFVNGTAIVELVDNDSASGATNLTGEFLGAALSGSVEPAGNDTVRVTTGADGVATILYSTDENTETFDTRKTAVLENDAAATDFSNVSFVGTLVIEETGSLSGIVTNEQNEPLPTSVVFTEEFTVGSATDPNFRLSPAASADVSFADASAVELLEATWNLTYLPTGATQQVTGYNLTTSDIDQRIYGAANESVPADATDGLQTLDDIPSVSLTGSADEEGLTLLTFASSEASGQYTLPRVPADEVAPPVTGGAQYNTVRAYQLGAESIQTGDGDSVAEGVNPNQTQEANIVIPGAEPVDFTLSGLEAPATVNASEAFDVSFILSNSGTAAGTTTVEFRLSTGDLTEDTVLLTRDVTVGPEDSELVEFENLSIDAAGEYNHGVFTDGESLTATITVEGAEGDLATQYDANGDGTIQFEEVRAAVTAFQQGELTFEEARAIIAEFRGDQQWSNV